jgi:glutathione S-transferase
LKIWGRHTSINVQKVLWTCAELGLVHERVDVGGAFGGLDAPDYLRKNPNGRIPVLEDDGLVLWESNTIVRYLAATHSLGDLCPADPRERADAERWMDWQLCHVLPGMVTLFFGLVRKAPEHSDPRLIEQAAARTEQAMRILDAHLAGRDYILGKAFTMADIPLGAFAHRWLALPMARPRLQHITTWYHTLSLRPAYRAHVMLPLQ